MDSLGRISPQGLLEIHKILKNLVKLEKLQNKVTKAQRDFSVSERVPVKYFFQVSQLLYLSFIPKISN